MSINPIPLVKRRIGPHSLSVKAYGGDDADPVEEVENYMDMAKLGSQGKDNTPSASTYPDSVGGGSTGQGQILDAIGYGSAYITEAAIDVASSTTSAISSIADGFEAIIDSLNEYEGPPSQGPNNEMGEECSSSTGQCFQN